MCRAYADHAPNRLERGFVIPLTVRRNGKMVAVLSALPKEIEATIDALREPAAGSFAGRRVVQGRLAGNDVVAGCTGVGKALAAMTTQGLIDRYHPDVLIYTGIAGGLNQSYKIGDVVVAQECVQHDFDATTFGFSIGTIPNEKIAELPGTRELIDYVLNWNAGTRTLHVGRILSGDRFVTSARAPEDTLWEELKGDAVDMESAAAALVAGLNGVPFAAVRFISDMADGVVPGGFKAFLKETSVAILDFAVHVSGFRAERVRRPGG
jgi:5'-methylthioadenosine/S-adenosylhomocysteine nucleosidase